MSYIALEKKAVWQPALQDAFITNSTGVAKQWTIHKAELTIPMLSDFKYTDGVILYQFNATELHKYKETSAYATKLRLKINSFIKLIQAI